MKGGDCVDVFAPGDGITSAWGGSDDSYATLSGSSMGECMCFPETQSRAFHTSFLSPVLRLVVLAPDHLLCLTQASECTQSHEPRWNTLTNSPL